MTGTPVSSARRAAPDLNSMGHWSGSRVRVPSGKIPTTSPALSAARVGARTADGLESRLTGIRPIPLMIQPKSGTENIDFFARNRTAVSRFMKYQHRHSGSTLDRWLGTRR